MKTIVRLLLLSVGCFLLMGMSEKKDFLEQRQNKIDSVFFYYYPMNHYPTPPFKFKFYNDTLFVSRFVGNHEDRSLNYSLCHKIVNQDTVGFVKEFVRLFITKKTENIILKDAEQIKETEYTSVIIRTYKNGEITENKYFTIYPEREYNPKFLRLCDLFLCIAKEYSPTKNTINSNKKVHKKRKK